MHQEAVLENCHMAPCSSSLLLDENLPCDVCCISDPLLVDTWLASQAELHFLQQQLSETAAVLITGREQLELSSALSPTSG